MNKFCTVIDLEYQPNSERYFSCIKNEPGAIFLDSGYPSAKHGRYDLITSNPERTLKPIAYELPAEFLARLETTLHKVFERADIAAPYTSPFCGGVIGYLSYDFGAALNDKQYEISNCCHQSFSVCIHII